MFPKGHRVALGLHGNMNFMEKKRSNYFGMHKKVIVLIYRNPQQISDVPVITLINDILC